MVEIVEVVMEDGSRAVEKDVEFAQVLLNTNEVAVDGDIYHPVDEVTINDEG